MSKKFLYLFKEGHDAFGGDQTTMKNTLGGKGAGLAEMTHAGMPVPQGFTITTEACTQYYADKDVYKRQPIRSAFSMISVLQLRTSTPVSISVVQTRTSISLSLSLIHI